MSTSTLLVINSANRSTDSKSSSDFNYDIGQTIEAASIAIKGISIPVTQYNVISPFNIFYYYVADDLYQVSFQPGQYSLAEMLTSIEAQFLASAAITVTFTQDPHTQKITFASAVPVKFYSQMESEGIYRLLTLLGLPAESTPTLYVTTLTFPYLPELQGLKNYYVLTRVLSQGSNGLFTGGIQEALQTNVPITVAFGQTQHYEPILIETSTITFARPINIQNLDIRIVDASLNPVDLNGSDVELIYKIWRSK